MRLTVEQSALAQALSDVAAAAARKPSLPILACVLISVDEAGLRVTTTDLSMSLTSAVAYESAETVAAAFATEFSKLAAIVRALPADGAVQLELDEPGKHLVVKSGRSRFRMQTLPAVDFPAIEAPRDATPLALDGLALAGLLRQVAFAAATNDVRYYLNGVLLRFSDARLTAVATDGHRLGFAHLPLAHGLAARDLIIPLPAIAPLLKLCERSALVLSLSDSQVSVDAGTRRLSTKLIDGAYPDYERILPDEAAQGGHARVARAALLAAIKRAVILANEQYKGLRFEFDQELKIVALSNENSAEEIVALDGPPHVTVIGAKAQYLIDCLSATDAEQVVLSYHDAVAPIVIRPDSESPPTWVVMPMRL